MKRIIIVCLFITALFYGFVTVDAKTNRKSSSKTKSKSITTKTFDASTFLYKSRGCIIINPNLERALKRLGFTKNSQGIYVKDGIEVYIGGLSELIISFNNTEDLDKFIDSTKSFGITWEGGVCTNSGQFCTDFWADGNKFEMFVGFD